MVLRTHKRSDIVLGDGFLSHCYLSFFCHLKIIIIIIITILLFIIIILIIIIIINLKKYY